MRVDFDVDGRAQLLSLTSGFLGTIQATSSDGAHTFVIRPGDVITRDGVPYSVPDQLAKELDDALVATFSPDSALPPRPFETHVFGDRVALEFPEIGLTLWAPTTMMSTVNRIDVAPRRILPLAFTVPLIKLGLSGPSVSAGLAQHAPPGCQLAIGTTTYATIEGPCLGPDARAPGTLASSMGHTTEAFTFDLAGTRLQIGDAALDALAVVQDGDQPAMTDKLQAIEIDDSTIVTLANDRVGNVETGALDLHGLGLVQLEYARLVQAALNVSIPVAQQHQLGDPACLAPAVTTVYPAGCTGFEGFVTAATAPTGTTGLDVLAIGGTALLALDPAFGGGLAPGPAFSLFCLDAHAGGYTNCTAGGLFTGSLAQVTKVLAHGDPAQLPPGVSDPRFFINLYMQALVKYLKVVGTSETVAGVHGARAYSTNLTVDGASRGRFERAHYLDGTYASPSRSPFVVEVELDPQTDQIGSYRFTQALDRGEQAVGKSALLGSERRRGR